MFNFGGAAPSSQVTSRCTCIYTIEGAFEFLEAKKNLRRKYLYGENKLAANFHFGSETIETHTLTNDGNYYMNG